MNTALIISSNAYWTIPENNILDTERKVITVTEEEKAENMVNDIYNNGY
jgi:hypothetical protein